MISKSGALFQTKLKRMSLYVVGYQRSRYETRYVSDAVMYSHMDHVQLLNNMLMDYEWLDHYYDTIIGHNGI
jgi:hypothetical protein